MVGFRTACPATPRVGGWHTQGSGCYFLPVTLPAAGYVGYWDEAIASETLKPMLETLDRLEQTLPMLDALILKSVQI